MSLRPRGPGSVPGGSALPGDGASGNVATGPAAALPGGEADGPGGPPTAAPLPSAPALTSGDGGLGQPGGGQ
ncbi:MAG: ATP-binding protein, partial [Cyanobacteriota bacterium]|nr:ATP-binding protein [Cyanobacteriota bacterium]